jgi:hypothetical protein
MAVGSDGSRRPKIVANNFFRNHLAIGPVDKTCLEVNNADKATKQLILVWLYGYASGAN